MDSSNYIEDYLNNRLSQEDRKRFEDKMDDDNDFAKEVKEHALLMNAFDEAKAEELSLRFNTIEEELSTPITKEFRISVYLKWAAAILVLAMLSVLVYFNSNDPDKDLFMAYYTPYPNVEKPVSRSGSNQRDVWMFYEQGNYAEASKLFSRLVSQDETDFAAWFYLGICELEQNKIKEAENAFAKVLQQQDSKYFEQAQWYSALSYLRSGKENEAKKILEEIIAANSGYGDKAKLLIADMQ